MFLIVFGVGGGDVGSGGGVHVMPGTRYSLDRVLDLGNFKA